MGDERGGLRSGLVWLGASLAILAGCAPVYEATGTASSQDLSQLRSEINSLKTAAQRTRADTEATAGRLVDQRLREQAAETGKQLAALTARIDTLSTELTALSARSKELGQRLDAAGRAAASPARPTPAPASPAGAPATARAPSSPPATNPSPSAPATPTAPAPVSIPPAAPAAPSPRPATGTPQAEDVYQAAYIDFSKGNYALAIPAFREFLRRYSEHKLADSAQYWIGESHLALAHGLANSGGQGEKVTQELEQAVREFRKVLANHPRGEKVPTALYKEALALVELNQVAVAEQRLQYLIDHFPRAEEAPLARDRLASLKER